MKYKKIKNIIALLMALVMIFSLTGCNSVGKNQADHGEAYAEQLVVSEWRRESIHRIYFHHDAVYFTAYWEIGDGQDYYSSNRLFSVNRNGDNLQEIPIDLTKEEPLAMITSVMIDDDDTISIWLSSNDSTEVNDVNVFIKVDSTGKELMRKDMNALVNGQYVNKALETSQGQIAVMAENNVYIFDESLELVHEIDIEGRSIGMAFTKDNQIVCATEDSNEKQKFQIIDMEQGKVVKTISLNRRESVNENAVFDSTQYDFCYRNDKGIYGYDIENQKSTCLMSYEKSNLISEDIVDAISVGMDDFMLVNYPQDGGGCSIAMYTKPDASVENEKTVITFGAFQFDENMKRAALNFNKTNAKYQIVLKEYFDEDNGEITADEAIESLNKDIAKGETPDILDLSVLTEQYASKGLFEDLMAYIEKDDELSEELFVNSVFDAMKQEDKLYYISPDFGISTLIGKAGYEDGYTEWSMEKLTAFYEQQKDKMLFYADTKIDLLDILLQGSFAEFCDWESGECQFDSQEFIDILTFCNLAISEDNRLDSNMTKDEAIQQEKVLWIDETNFVPQEIASYRKLFGGELAYIGYPKKEGSESYFSFDHQIGICSESKVKDGAWEFFRMLLSYEYQEQCADLSKGMERIPIRQDCFDLLLERLSNPQEDSFEEENDILSSSQEEAFRNLVTNTHTVVSYDIEMMKIIEEEAQRYFEGAKDENKVVQLIQKRCTTYMNEKR
ncbi:MAG: hypothetical protein K2H34_11220 [Lachnospiraceae bacterium]|nr:hypothetical protein [Lachnospiraceae bacterium]